MKSHSAVVNGINKILVERKRFIIFNILSQYFSRVCESSHGKLPPGFGLSEYD
jgi:hypothetical protein